MYYLCVFLKGKRKIANLMFEIYFCHIVLSHVFGYLFQDEFAGDGVDLYDDVIAAPAGGNGGVSSSNTGDGGDTTSPNEETNGNAPYHQLGNNIQPNQIGRRHQLYIGNLTWVYNIL
jgi:hypothetical protein